MARRGRGAWAKSLKHRPRLPTGRDLRLEPPRLAEIIGIHSRHELRPSQGEALVEGPGQPAVRPGDDADAGIPDREAPQDPRGAVGGAVVQRDQLEVLKGLMEHGADGLAQVTLGLVRRQEDGQRGRRGGALAAFPRCRGRAKMLRHGCTREVPSTMRVCFICRGYPGLGKVMGAVAIDDMLARSAARSYESLFLTYDRGAAYFKSTGGRAIDLFAEAPPLANNAFCTPFGREGARAVQAIEEFRPDLVINDGEPYLIDLTREVLGVPTVVLAHPLDLHNPGNTPLAVSLFRHFYARADLVIAHGFTRLPEERTDLGGRAGRVVELNTIIRPGLHRAIEQRTPRDPSRARLVAVLGGGSKNSSTDFRDGTRTLGAWTLQACRELGIGPATLFAADRELDEELAKVAGDGSPVQRIAEPMDNTDALVHAELVIGRAGRNLVSEFVALGKRGIVVPVSGPRFRTSGQVQAAEDAVRHNPNLRMCRLDEGYDTFVRTLRAVTDAPTLPVDWKPGNAAALEALRTFLGSRGLA